MTVRKKGRYWYADSQPEIRDVLVGYSTKNGYPATHFKDATCVCGGKLFKLSLEDDEGAAVRTCPACGHEHPVGDSEEYLEEATLGECDCLCGGRLFEITVGVALHEDNEDVRWIYIGCRCPECGITGSYGDWKNEYPGYQELLDHV